MIIDTNGFEIGDEVWVEFHSMTTGLSSPCSFIIDGFAYRKNEIIIMNDYNAECYAKDAYLTQQECQLECDNLNGINHD